MLKRVVCGIMLAVLLLSSAQGKEIDWSKACKIREGVSYVSIEKEVKRKGREVVSETIHNSYWPELKRVDPKTRRIEGYDPKEHDTRLMKIIAMRVDLKLAGLTFTGLGRDEKWGQPMPDHEPWKYFPDRKDAKPATIRTLRTTVPNFMKNNRAAGREMIVGFNTAPWGPWEKPYTHKYGNPAGIEISDGVVVADNRNNYRAIFCVWKDGRIEVREDIAKEDYDKVWCAHTGFGIVMLNGEDRPGGGYEAALMPRMAVGVDKDRHYLYVITIDGRLPGWSEGAYGSEVTAVMRDAGAWDVVDFDGGGSATLCYWDEEKKAPVKLSHADDKLSGYCRPCGMVMGLYLKKDK